MEVFQMGILQTNKSLIDLYEKMKNKYNIGYIITKKLNQDCLEDFFGHLRARNGCEVKPSALQCLRSIKVISLGKNISILKRNINSEEDSGVTYLISESFKKAQLQLCTTECIIDIDTRSESSVDYDDEEADDSIKLTVWNT